MHIDACIVAVVGDRADRAAARVRAHPLDNLGASRMMTAHRRESLRHDHTPPVPCRGCRRRNSGLYATGSPMRPRSRSQPRPTRIGVSTYSFWQFKNEDLRDLEKCIDLAAEMGFDGVEILHRQMKDETPGYLQKLKQRAFLNGLSLCGFSTHQGFLFPKKESGRRTSITRSSASSWPTRSASRRCA